jgi:FMN phosphatase YigB (HAD superfamily)
MAHIGPLKAVFFDIGNTLGTVAADEHGFKLVPFGSSPALLHCFREVLGVKLGIITNIPPEMSDDGVRALLSAAGLLAFFDNDTIVTSRDAGVSKPDVEIYRLAAQRAGLTVFQCLYVGEDAQEVAGAQKAGMAGLLKPA